MKSSLHKLHLARGLSSSGWRILIEAWWRLLYFHTALTWVSCDRLAASVRTVYGGLVDPAAALPIAQEYQRLILWAARLHLVSMTCLDRSLTLQWMLSRRGIPARMRIGVKKSPPGVQAHAWVEVSGMVPGETQDVSSRFTTLDLPARP